MGKIDYTTKYRRKHILEVKRDNHTISSDELIELDELIRYFYKFLHRVGASDNYKPF